MLRLRWRYKIYIITAKTIQISDIVTEIAVYGTEFQLISSLLRDVQLTEVRMNDDSTQKILDSTKLTIESLTCLLASIAAAIKSTGDLGEKRSKRENNLFFSSVSDDVSCTPWFSTSF